VQCPARLRHVSASVIYCHRQTFSLSALLPVVPAVRTLGSCAAWFIATSHLDLGAKQAGRTRSCLLEEKDKRKIYALKAVPILRQTYANFLAY
jgi:hypothetical protein